MVPCLFSISMECNSLMSHIAWVWKKMMCLEYALSKWYEAFWGKPNTKTMWAWPKVDNIISFRVGCYKLHCSKGLYQGVLIELINQNEPVICFFMSLSIYLLWMDLLSFFLSVRCDEWLGIKDMQPRHSSFSIYFELMLVFFYVRLN